MLCLTRKIGETIVVNGPAQFTILSVLGEKVRVGIEAPDYVRIDRLEIHNERIAGFPKKEAVA